MSTATNPALFYGQYQRHKSDVKKQQDWGGQPHPIQHQISPQAPLPLNGSPAYPQQSIHPPNGIAPPHRQQSLPLDPHAPPPVQQPNGPQPYPPQNPNPSGHMPPQQQGGPMPPPGQLPPSHNPSQPGQQALHPSQGPPVGTPGNAPGIMPNRQPSQMQPMSRHIGPPNAGSPFAGSPRPTGPVGPSPRLSQMGPPNGLPPTQREPTPSTSGPPHNFIPTNSRAATPAGGRPGSGGGVGGAMSNSPSRAGPAGMAVGVGPLNRGVPGHAIGNMFAGLNQQQVDSAVVQAGLSNKNLTQLTEEERNRLQAAVTKFRVGTPRMPSGPNPMMMPQNPGSMNPPPPPQGIPGYPGQPPANGQQPFVFHGNQPQQPPGVPQQPPQNQQFNGQVIHPFPQARAPGGPSVASYSQQISQNTANMMRATGGGKRPASPNGDSASAQQDSPTNKKLRRNGQDTSPPVGLGQPTPAGLNGPQPPQPNGPNATQMNLRVPSTAVTGPGSQVAMTPAMNGVVGPSTNPTLRQPVGPQNPALGPGRFPLASNVANKPPSMVPNPNPAGLPIPMTNATGPNIPSPTAGPPMAGMKGTASRTPVPMKKDDVNPSELANSTKSSPLVSNLKQTPQPPNSLGTPGSQPPSTPVPMPASTGANTPFGYNPSPAQIIAQSQMQDQAGSRPGSSAQNPMGIAAASHNNMMNGRLTAAPNTMGLPGGDFAGTDSYLGVDNMNFDFDTLGSLPLGKDGDMFGDEIFSQFINNTGFSMGDESLTIDGAGLSSGTTAATAGGNGS